MSALQISAHGLTWYCVILLGVRSFLSPQDMIQTSLPGQVEHFIAHAEPAITAEVEYEQRRVRRPSSG
jgi:hypothetical protein